MNQFCLSEYEKAFLCRIIENNMIWKEYLIEQIENSIIVSRDNTGCGCYIDFQVNLERTNLNKYENIPIFFEGDITAPDKSDAATFLLYTTESLNKAGRIIDFLEVVIAGTNYDEVEVYSWLKMENSLRFGL